MERVKAAVFIDALDRECALDNALRLVAGDQEILADPDAIARIKAKSTR